MLMRIGSGTLFVAVAFLACGGIVDDGKASSRVEASDGGASARTNADGGAIANTKANAVTCKTSITASAPTSFTSSDSEIFALAIDDSNIYFIDGDGLEKIPLSGGTKTTLSSDATDFSAHIVMNDTTVFWSASNAIESISKSGGKSAQIATIPYAGTLVLSATHLYFAPDNNTIRSVAIGGGDVTTLVNDSNLIEAFAIDSSSLYWHTRPIASGSAFELRKISLDGGPVTDLDDTQSDANPLLVDGSNVVFNGINGIGQVPVSGGGASEIFRGFSGDSGFTLALDEGKLYWAGTLANAPGILRGDSSGCTSIVTTASDVVAIAIGASRIFWIDASDDYTIHSVPKP